MNHWSHLNQGILIDSVNVNDKLLYLCQILRRHIIWQQSYALKYMSTYVWLQDVITWNPFLYYESFVFVTAEMFVLLILLQRLEPTISTWLLLLSYLLLLLLPLLSVTLNVFVILIVIVIITFLIVMVLFLTLLLLKFCLKWLCTMSILWMNRIFTFYKKTSGISINCNKNTYQKLDWCPLSFPLFDKRN